MHTPTQSFQRPDRRFSDTCPATASADRSTRTVAGTTIDARTPIAAAITVPAPITAIGITCAQRSDIITRGWMKVDPTFRPLRGNPRFEKTLLPGIKAPTG